MNAYIPKGRSVPRIRLEVAPGKWVVRSTGTRDSATAKRIHAMIRALGRRGARAYDLLGKVGRCEWSLMDLYDRYQNTRGDLQAMRADSEDVLLEPLFAPFLAFVTSDSTADTAQHYGVYLRALVASGVTRRTHLTIGKLSAWLSALEKSAGTRRKYAAGVSAFCAWLVRRGVLDRNPMRDVPKPSAPDGRESFLETAQAVQLADAQPEPWRSLSAVLAGTALDLSAALTLTRQQVDLEHWTITLRRPKSNTPQVIVVAEWSRPYLARACQGKLAAATLFAGADRFNAGKQHRAACKALGLVNYWVRDARHTWAVRFARAGGSPAQAAEQMGHADGGVLFLKVYGRYRPTVAERAEVESRAALRDRRGA